MEITILFNDSSPKYIQIYEQIKKAIITKKYFTDNQLPSKRFLANELGVSIHTVKEAYEQLLAEGFIYSKERAGYYVSPFDFDWHQIENDEVQNAVVPDHKIEIDFHHGHIDTEAFPVHLWRKLTHKHLQAENLLNGEWQGEILLRKELAKYVERSRGVQCDTSQIYIYSGTQNQLVALCHFFGNSHVGLEEPGFKRARSVFLQCGLNVLPIEVDEYGVTVPDIDLQLLYTTPAHQFPLGMVMTSERRVSLLNWASEKNVFIIEDDYDSEFRYKGYPIPSLTQMDQLQHVIYFGTFSKTLLPSMRISYMILPKSLIDKFNVFNRDHKTTVSKIDQLILADFLNEGLFDRHLAKMRTLYRKKRNVLLDCIEKYLSHDFVIKGEQSGLHIVLKLPITLNEEKATMLANSVGVGVHPITSSYQFKPKQEMVILGYGGLTFEQIEIGIKRLAEVWT